MRSRDIKPENILLEDDHRTAKIADLGLCRELSSDQQGAITTGVGTPAFIAPEALTGPYDERADIWSLGCVLACMETDSGMPYESVGECQSMMAMVISGRLRPELPSTSPAHAFVRDCCQLHPECRPTAAQLATRMLGQVAEGG